MIVIFPFFTTTSSEKNKAMSLVSETSIELSAGVELFRVGAVSSKM